MKFTSFNKRCFSFFSYTGMIRLNNLKRKMLRVSSVSYECCLKMFRCCGGLRAVILFIDRSAMFVEAFGFSYVSVVCDSGYIASRK